jgi:hypothetical protein
MKLRQAMSSADFDAAWNEGRDWPVDRAIRGAAPVEAQTAVAVD